MLGYIFIMEYRSSASQYQSVIQQYETALVGVNGEIKKLLEKNKSLQDDLNQAKSQNNLGDALKNQISTLDPDGAALLETLQRQLQQAHNENLDLKQQNKQSKDQIDYLSCRESEMRTKMNQLNDTIIELEQADMNNEDIIFELRKKNKQLLIHKQEISE